MASFRVLLTVATEPTVNVAGTFTTENDELPEEGALITVASKELEDGEHTAQVIAVTPGDAVPIRAFRL